MRPGYHITPKQGFLNDPNGLAQFREKYHVFYQWLPDVVLHGSKRWRHCVSEDLVHWIDQGCGLEPTEWYEKQGCYSGSGIVSEGKYYIFYTGNVRDREGGRRTYQCMAVSENGETFAKKGPVVCLPRGYTPHFRDPKVWKKNGRWWMMVGAQTTKHKGNVALFVSEDPQNWRWVGNLLEESRDWGFMCECPDILEIQGQEFLVLSIQKREGSVGMVFAGRMDYQRGRFLTDPKSGRFIDEGLDFYAPQSFWDESGRCLMLGWIGAGTQEYQLSQPAAEEGWLHSLTIPRVVGLYKGKLCQRPAEELKMLRGKEMSAEGKGSIVIDRGSASLEILAECPKGENVAFDLGTVLMMDYIKENHLVRFRRKRWGMPGYDEKSFSLVSLDRIHIFLDYSTAEVFLNDGETTFTFKAYFDKNTEMRFFSEGKITINTWLLEVA